MNRATQRRRVFAACRVEQRADRLTKRQIRRAFKRSINGAETIGLTLEVAGRMAAEAAAKVRRFAEIVERTHQYQP